ncbi:hypothetical protein [Nitrospirillum bahiense]|uniref:HTH HARE-type domain-containing protein n=1 Tax=Nitrospirillum amazonense TaxID=28077 RepID=A0A560G0Y1_9PROT|nr:hypothetical protein [Nitrospirillum amazonense]TWB27558.1 hypothetical protein FBZ88_10617 [Nitrospirillum amazonense]
MPKLTTNQIKSRVRQLLGEAPDGMRWSEVARKIETESPETSPNTIQGSIQSLFKEARDITKIRRGVYVLIEPPGEESGPETTDTVVAVPAGPGAAIETVLREDAFYQPFADWLKELEEVTYAAAIGGNALGGKWGTPDVIGVLKPKKADLIKFDLQIITAEIKIDPSQPVVAFGQAIAYRLFSHRSFIVVPDIIGADNYDRLEALSILYGIGLVTFKPDPREPKFSLRVRAQTIQPDMFYVNQMAKRLHDYSANIFENLF